MFYARHVARESQLIFASAGHEPAYLVRGSTGLVEELAAPRGRAIGLAPRATYSHGRTSMDPGDTLVLYTDGLLERKTSAGEWIEPTNLPRLLSDIGSKRVDEAVRHVVDALDSMSGTGGHADDCGLLMARCEAVSVVDVPPDPAEVSQACREVCCDLGARGVPEDTQKVIRLALDEALTNAARHGSGGPAESIKVRYSVGARQVKLTVTDEGPGIWDAGSKVVAPDALAGSGYGLSMMCDAMDHVEWSAGGNELFMVKRLQPAVE